MEDAAIVDLYWQRSDQAISSVPIRPYRKRIISMADTVIPSRITFARTMKTRRSV